MHNGIAINSSLIARPFSKIGNAIEPKARSKQRYDNGKFGRKFQKTG